MNEQEKTEETSVVGASEGLGGSILAETSTNIPSNTEVQYQDNDGANQQSSDPINRNASGYTGEVSNDQSTREESNQTQVQSVSDDEKEKMLEQYIQDALASNLLALNYFSIKKTYPKAHKLLSEYMSDKARMPMNEEMGVGTLLYTPRSVVYEFFDTNEIFVNIRGSRENWTYSINGLSATNRFEKSRVLSEYGAFLEAFKMLEEK